MIDINEYFLSIEVFEQYKKIASEFGLQSEQIPTLEACVWRFVKGEYSEEELKKQLEQKFGFDDNKVANLLSSIAFRVFAPVLDELSIVKESVLLWSKSVQQKKSAKSNEAARTFVLRYSDDFDQQKLHRLERTLTEYLERKLSKDQTIEMLGRPLKLAGLEIDPEFAREMLGQLDREYPRAILETFEEKDAMEIQKVKEIRKDILQPTISSLDEVVEKICFQLPTIIADPKLSDRCKEIISTRVHDVRNMNETREILARPVEKGGLGVSGQELDKLVQTIEADVQDYFLRKQKEVKKEQQEKLKEKQEQIKKQEQMKQKEQQLLTKRYIAMTGKIPTEPITPAAPPLARATAAMSVQNHMTQQASRIDAQKVRQVIEKTLPLQQKPIVHVQKPLVQDVQFIRRLAGPTEELGSLDLERFRRLSKEPAQAAQRIKDMLDLLENQGYEKRVQGMKAFRSSPVYRQYTNIIQQALLSGKAVDTVLQDMKREEYNALMKLNEEIRF